jgi:hypothetical protein
MGACEAMARLPGTDIWYRTYVLPNNTRESYQFAVAGHNLTDPLNPLQYVFPSDPEAGLTGWVSSVLELPAEGAVDAASILKPSLAEKYSALEFDEKISLYLCSYYFDKKNSQKTIYWANKILDNNPDNTSAIYFRAILIPVSTASAPLFARKAFFNP